MAMYYIDGLYYAATIRSVSQNNGKAVVTFVDYAEENETVSLCDIYPKRLWEQAGYDLSGNHLGEGNQNNDSVMYDASETESSFTSFSETPQYSTQSRKSRKGPRTPQHAAEQSSPFPDPPHFPSFKPPPPPQPAFMPVSSAAAAQGAGGHGAQQISKEAMSNMLASWYMAGYHTGYYRGFASRQNETPQKRKRKSFYKHT